SREPPYRRQRVSLGHPFRSFELRNFLTARKANASNVSLLCSVWIASSLRADIIFGKDRLEQVAKLRQSSLAILRARCQGQNQMKVMNPIQLSLSLAGIAVRSQRLMVDFLTRHHEVGGLGDPAGIGQAFLDLTAKMIADPMSTAQTQLELWKEHVK